MLSRFLQRTVRGTCLLVALLFLVGAEPADTKLPFKMPRSARELAEAALIETDKGDFEIEFYRNEAPVTVANFQHLAANNFYQDLTFHHYVPGFIVQGGDPLGNGKGGPKWTLPPEFSDVKHVRGTVGMAKLPNSINPERRSNGSQFYITLRQAKHMDGLYTVFGHVTRGMEIVELLRPGDRIIRVRLSSDVKDW